MLDIMIEDYAIVQRFLRDDLINTKIDFTGHACIYRFAGKASSFPACILGWGGKQLYFPTCTLFHRTVASSLSRIRRGRKSRREEGGGLRMSGKGGMRSPVACDGCVDRFFFVLLRHIVRHFHRGGHEVLDLCGYGCMRDDWLQFAEELRTERGCAGGECAGCTG